MRDYENTAKALRCCRLTSARGCAECPYSVNNNEKCAHLLNDAAVAIEELLAEKAKIENSGKLLASAFERLKEKVPRWISVEERLPERYNPVLVTYIGFNSNSLLSDMVAYRDGDGDWCWWDGEFPSGEMCKVKVTHWMPLPEPPKEVRDA